MRLPQLTERAFGKEYRSGIESCGFPIWGSGTPKAREPKAKGRSVAGRPARLPGASVPGGKLELRHSLRSTAVQIQVGVGRHQSLGAPKAAIFDDIPLSGLRLFGEDMAQVCDICGKGPQFGKEEPRGESVECADAGQRGEVRDHVDTKEGFYALSDLPASSRQPRADAQTSLGRRRPPWLSPG